MEPIAPNATKMATISSKSKILLREGGVDSRGSGCSDMVNILMLGEQGLKTSAKA
jgi:hypothetical protein